MPLKSLSPAPDLAERCYDALLDAIATGELRPGERYTQEALAAALGVSRQPILQALQALKRQGLVVETDNRRGVQVVPLDATFVENLYRVRSALDGAAARAAARAPRPDLGAAGTRLIRAGRAAAARRDLKALVDSDLRFHALLYDASRNPLLIQTAAVHLHHTRRLMTTYLQQDVSLRAVWIEHEAILEAVVIGDPRRAERLAREHADAAEAMILGLLFEQQGGTEENGERAASR